MFQRSCMFCFIHMYNLLLDKFKWYNINKFKKLFTSHTMIYDSTITFLFQLHT